MCFAGPSLALLPFFAVAACGSLDSDTTTPTTLATVTGTITNPQALTVASDAMRVAVVWDAAGEALPDGSFATYHRSSQDISVASPRARSSASQSDRRTATTWTSARSVSG